MIGQEAEGRGYLPVSWGVSSGDGGMDVEVSEVMDGRQLTGILRNDVMGKI